MTASTRTLILPETIKTGRLVLRTPDLADAPALRQLADNKSIYKMLARLPHPYTDEHALDFITNMARSADEHAWAITTGNKEFIGIIGLHLNRKKGPELGYWLGQPYWGKGYASEAALALCQAASVHGINKIAARAISGNKASIGVLEKCGFIKIDERIDDCGRHKGVSVAFFELAGNK